MLGGEVLLIPVFGLGAGRIRRLGLYKSASLLASLKNGVLRAVGFLRELLRDLNTNVQANKVESALLLLT